jgi:hypothetical protein
MANINQIITKKLGPHLSELEQVSGDDWLEIGLGRVSQKLLGIWPMISGLG